MAFSKEENQELLELFADFRVADVRDGMDWSMRHYIGSVSPAITPLWRTTAIGIARTARYLPYQGHIPTMSAQEYTEWSKHYYGNICTYPFMKEIEEGDFVVIDQSGVDAGLMGSNNSLGGVKSGARGYVTNGGVRDTDEIILQKIPFWSAFCSQKMVQGRLQFDSMDVPVAIGGVTVCPGDVVVADGDGVIVVPRKLAKEVAIYARQELESDKKGRRRLYEALNMPLDESVLEKGEKPE
ncbi:MAG: RraA family protein [Candidatus Sumerlaeia bacterium]